MAKVLTENGANISGSIGDAVYVRYRGGTYIRKRPTIRKEARTPAMLRNQHRFTCITKFCVQFKHTLIKQIWNDIATTCSGYNLFMKSNTAAFARDGSLSDPLLLKFSVGRLMIPQDMMVQWTTPEAITLKVSWIKEPSISGTRAKDELMMISSDGESFSLMTPTGIKRKDLEGEVELPAMAWTGRYVYLFFMSEDRRGFSQSLAFDL